MQRLLIGTGNRGKITEIRDALSGVPFDIVSPADIGVTEVPHEEGRTFEENARQKALFYFRKSGLPTLADDSGILVEALYRELGIHTRRWGAGKDASDQEWVDYFLSRMQQEENKRAMFVCTLCYIDAAGKEHLFEGRCTGYITDDLEAPISPGIPMSSCFVPDGQTRVLAAMTPAEKNEVSHRGHALMQFRAFLRQHVVGIAAPAVAH